MALTNPQPILLLQDGDLIEGGSFDNWLDAIDGSFCTFEGTSPLFNEYMRSFITLIDSLFACSISYRWRCTRVGEWSKALHKSKHVLISLSRMGYIQTQQPVDLTVCNLHCLCQHVILNFGLTRLYFAEPESCGIITPPNVCACNFSTLISLPNGVVLV